MLQSRRAYFVGKGVGMVEVGWLCHDVGMRFHGQEVGPASILSSLVGQRRYFLLGIQNHLGEVDVGDLHRTREWAWSWIHGNCAALRGGGEE